MNMLQQPDQGTAMKPESTLAHAPADHPKVTFGKIGILLANLGTPDHYSYWPMRRYLNEFLSDKRVIDYSPWIWQPLLQLVILTKRPFSSGAAYKSIWNEDRNESPLMTITKDQTAKMKARLEEAYGDRSWSISACATATRRPSPRSMNWSRRAARRSCSSRFIRNTPVRPRPPPATSSSARCSTSKWQPIARTVEPYYEHPLYIEALAQSVERAYAGLENRPDVLVASYHGVPKRYLMEGDPYHCQCQKTSRLLKERLGWADTEIVTTFQSRFGPEEWLKPYTVEEVARLAEQGKKRIAVVAPAFSADCIETLEEINEEIRESFEEAGGEEFTYIPCLNDDDAHIDALSAVVSRT
jgi:ferrochelatase